jgi:hypothetical protein
MMARVPEIASMMITVSLVSRSGKKKNPHTAAITPEMMITRERPYLSLSMLQNNVEAAMASTATMLRVSMCDRMNPSESTP